MNPTLPPGAVSRLRKSAAIPSWMIGQWKRSSASSGPIRRPGYIFFFRAFMFLKCLKMTPSSKLPNSPSPCPLLPPPASGGGFGWGWRGKLTFLRGRQKPFRADLSEQPHLAGASEVKRERLPQSGAERIFQIAIIGVDIVSDRRVPFPGFPNEPTPFKVETAEGFAVGVNDMGDPGGMRAARGLPDGKNGEHYGVARLSKPQISPS